MDILAEVNKWDRENGKTIATDCGLEELSLYQYLVLLERIRTNVDKLIPLGPVDRDVITATIEAITDNAVVANTSAMEDRFLDHLLKAENALKAGKILKPAERLSLVTCLTVLISQIGSFLATAQVIST